MIMPRAILFAILAVFLVLEGCSKTDPKPLYGEPTFINDNQTALDALCQIQREFRALPKPLMEKKTYTGSWTSYNFGAASVKHQGFYRFHLRPEAIAFLSRHSRLEVVASLLPLFTDPQVGGEAAVMLAGIPAGSDSQQGSRTRGLGNILNNAVYQTPSSPGRWFDKAHEHRRAAISLYGLNNTTESIHRTTPANYKNTLEYEIVKVIKDFSRLPLRAYAEGPPRMPQPHNKELVEQWIANHSAPALNPKAIPIIEAHRHPFSALAIYPLLPFPTNSIEGNEVYFMWMLQLQDQYWPSLLSLTTGRDQINKLRNTFRQQYIEAMRTACPL